MTAPESNADHAIRRVLLTGASGFVGRYVLRELITRGYQPVCLLRSPEELARVVPEVRISNGTAFPRPGGPLPDGRGSDGGPLPDGRGSDWLSSFKPARYTTIRGDIVDGGALRAAAEGCHAAIHLVGIIVERRWRGQTFDRVHRLGTMAVVDALRVCGVRRYVHMSALGVRADAVSNYHKTKFAAEQYVRESGLDWTIFQPSLIHGPDGEFMELMKRFACGWLPPVMPYFGRGESHVQPVSVRDVAYCLVNALRRMETVGATYPLGGPTTYTWKELYETCRRLISGVRRWKPIVSLPLPMARLLAGTIMKSPLVPMKLKFNADQVQMSQEDNVCPKEPVEAAFGIRLRHFEGELARYGDAIQ